MEAEKIKKVKTIEKCIWVDSLIVTILSIAYIVTGSRIPGAIPIGFAILMKLLSFGCDETGKSANTKLIYNVAADLNIIAGIMQIVVASSRYWL